MSKSAEIIHGIYRGCNAAYISTGDLFIEPATSPNHVGGIALATVTQVKNKGLQAFLSLPNGATGYLASKTPLRGGQKIAVQISAAASGSKAWPLSTELKHASHALIHIINGKNVGTSSRLPEAKATALKEALKNAKLPGGFIIRHHAAALSPAALIAEAERLLVAAPALESKAEGWLLAPPSPLDRALLEEPAANVVHDSERLTEILDTHIKPRIPFGQNSAITIAQTEALTAIDVDSGGNANLSAVNIEAAKLIATTLRSRNIGGQIIVDFCREADKDAAARLHKIFATALAADRLSVTLYGRTKMGLYELSRPRLGASLNEAISHAAK